MKMASNGISGRSSGHLKIQLRDKLLDHYAAQTDLCQELEQFADKLPNDVDRQTCIHLARSVLPIIKAAHAFEESELFPRLDELTPPSSSLTEILERLRFEHLEDESFAEEISDKLFEYNGQATTDTAETLAYMLRGFFECVRRHIAFERDHLLPLLAK